MDTIIYNLFLVNNINVIEDIQSVIKDTLLSCSCIKIIPPTLKELNDNKILYNNIIFKITSAKFSDETALMSFIMYSQPRVYYNTGISEKLIYFDIGIYDMNKMYITSIQDNCTTFRQLTFLRNCAYENFKQIHPIYYFP